MIGFYLTHPQVDIDPAIPVPDWRLSEKGRARLGVSLTKPWWRDISRIVSSDERKAVETARIIGETIGVLPETAPHLGENDRSTTGFLPPEEFEAAADRFFARPTGSWNGWETAADAQSRIVTAVEACLAGHDKSQPLLLVGHGAVGTLLKCHVGNRPIDRREDQQAGGGNIFAFALERRRLLCDWTPMEDFEGAGP